MSFFVGLPVNTQDFIRIGVEPLLDYLKTTAGVNAVIINSHTFLGECHYTPHEKYFTGTRLRDFRPEELKGYDVLGAVTGPAHHRGMQVYSHVLCYDSMLPATAIGGARVSDENGFEVLPHSGLGNLSFVLEIDVFGRKGVKPCINNPDYRQYYLALMEDQLRSYPIEGINFNIERAGPLENTLIGHLASVFPKRKPQAPACFCPYCIESARERGINVERARTGYLELLEFSERSWMAALALKDPLALEGKPLGNNRDITPPPDGYFIEFLRLLMRYPEILAWDQLWYDNLQRLFKEMYGTVKAVSPDRKMGWHVWHPRAYSPFTRAGLDISEMRRYSDWLKPKMDHTCAGYRLNVYAGKFIQALFSDRPLRQAYEALCAMLGWEEGPLEDLPGNGLSVEYLKRDTVRYINAVSGEVPIYPGIGLDMPSAPAGKPNNRPTEPEYVKIGLQTIAEAGAKGVVLSRAFNEMQHKNLVAAGEAIVEINKHFI
jgi:hypothetical protein